MKKNRTSAMERKVKVIKLVLAAALLLVAAATISFHRFENRVLEKYDRGSYGHSERVVVVKAFLGLSLETECDAFPERIALALCALSKG